MPSLRRRCSSQGVGMSRVWSRPCFGLARKCRNIRCRGFTGRGLQLRRVRQAGVWIISKTGDQNSLVDHCNPPCCCLYRDLFLCCSLICSSQRLAVVMISSQCVYESPTSQRSSRPRSDFRCAAIWQALYRAKRYQQRNRMRSFLAGRILL